MRFVLPFSFLLLTTGCGLLNGDAETDDSTGGGDDTSVDDTPTLGLQFLSLIHI